MLVYHMVLGEGPPLRYIGSKVYLNIPPRGVLEMPPTREVLDEFPEGTFPAEKKKAKAKTKAKSKAKAKKEE